MKPESQKSEAASKLRQFICVSAPCADGLEVVTSEEFHHCGPYRELGRVTVK